MDYAIVYSENYLAHHGIKGQRWGVRRFQNADGSYTAAGKERYGRGESRKNPEFTPRGESRKQKDLNADKRYSAAKNVSKDTKRMSTINNALSDIEKSSSSIEQIHYKYKSRRMSDEKLQSEIDKMLAKQKATKNRRDKEKQYQDLKRQEINTGREVLRDTLDIVGKVTTGATAAATLYLLLRQIAND